MIGRREGGALRRTAPAAGKMTKNPPWMLPSAIAGCFVIVLMSLTGCGPKTKISFEWKDPDVQPTPFAKVVAIAMSKDNIVRRVAEKEFVNRLPKQTEGVAGYTLISDSDRGDVDKVRAILAGRWRRRFPVSGCRHPASIQSGNHLLQLLGLLRMGLADGFQPRLHDDRAGDTRRVSRLFSGKRETPLVGNERDHQPELGPDGG